MIAPTTATHNRTTVTAVILRKGGAGRGREGEEETIGNLHVHTHYLSLREIKSGATPTLGHASHRSPWKINFRYM